MLVPAKPNGVRMSQHVCFI